MRKNITVIAKMNSEGVVSPLKIIWDDGKVFEIDKILDIRKKASTKGGGKGLRYTIQIANHERYIWLDDYFWFVEV